MKRKDLNNFVLLSLFAAIIALLGFTPLGLIPLGFINVTILCIPVIVGTILMGGKCGAVLGLVFGLVSFTNALMKPSALVATLMAESPIAVAVMSILPRVLVPVVAYGVYKLLCKKSEVAGVAVAAAAGSLTNTALYLGMMLLFYIMCGIDTAGVLALIGGVALIAGGCEAAAAVILCTPLVTALKKLGKGR